MKKGFSLAEMLIYIAISSVVFVVFSSSSFQITDIMNKSNTDNYVEITGLYVARAIENELLAGGNVVFPAIQDNLTIEATTSSLSNGIYNIDFIINKHDFSISLPYKG